MQRFALLTFVFLAVTAFSSCDELTEFTFDLRGPQVVFDVEEQDQATLIVEEQLNVATEVADALADNDVDSDRLRSIKATTARFELLTTNAGIDLGLIDEVRLRLSAPGLAPVTITDRDLRSVSGFETTLDVEDIELLELLREETVNYTLEMETNGPVPEPIQVGVRLEFAVVAQAL